MTGFLNTLQTAIQETDVNSIISSFDKYIVRPINAFGLGGFVFDVEGDSTTNLRADITDHYLEDNTAVQDHIALAPLTVTLKNYVGELVYREDATTETTLQDLTRKLTILDSYLPPIAKAAQQAKQFIEGGLSDFDVNSLSSSSVDKAVDIYAMVKNITPPIPRQAQAYMFFKALWEQKILVSLQTPFEFLSQMAIESITASQSEDSIYISDFTITLKQIKTVAIQNVPFNPADYQGRTGLQREETEEFGKTQGGGLGSGSNTSLLYEMFN